MSKKKSKYKGVQYIARSLTKYYPKQYSRYSDALPRSREILSELKGLNQKVTLKNIFAFVRTQKVGRKESPYIDSKLLQRSYYFELVDYPIYIARCSKEIYFTSKLFPVGVGEIQGGTIPDYEVYFAPFVNYANSMAAMTDPEERRYDTEWNVKCTLPVFNKSKKRWESEIMSVDSQDNQFDYGFNPKKPDANAKALILTKEPSKGDVAIQQPQELEKEAQKPVSPAKPDGERVKEIRALIADLRQDVKDGLISKEDYAKMVKDLTSKLDEGGVV